METARQMLGELLALGWTQERIAHESGTTQATVSRILAREIAGTKMGNWCRIHAVYLRHVQREPAGVLPYAGRLIIRR